MAHSPPSTFGVWINATLGEDDWYLLGQNRSNRSISMDDSATWNQGSLVPLSSQGKCAAVALPLALDTQIIKPIAWSYPYSIPCSLGLNQLAPVVILYFHPLTACMSLQDIE